MLITKTQNDEILYNLINRYYFNFFKKGEKTLEIFLRSKCTSNCKYCYLTNNEKLSPRELETDENLLLNLQSLLDFYIKNEFSCNIDLFTGQCILDGFLFRVFDILYKKFSDLSFDRKPRTITIPENCDFVEEEELLNKVQYYIDIFNNIGIKLCFSASVDGFFMEEVRDQKRSNEYYNKLFSFLGKNNFGVHPMISSYNIDKWIQNYKWWEKTNFLINDPSKAGFLEVRNNNWTDDNINNYIQLLNYIIDSYLNKYDLHALANKVLTLNVKGKGCEILSCPSGSINQKKQLRCSLTHSLVIRLADLAIIPCHRLGYEHFVSGYLIKDENDNIFSLSEKNVAYLISTLSWHMDSAPQCNSCYIKDFCMGPCLGSNYESTGSSFITGESVCKLLKAKYTFLIMKYEDIGLLKYIEENNLNPDFINKTKKFLKNISNGVL